MRKKYLTISPPETKKLGEKLAKEILKGGFRKNAVVIGLEGELGGGKTTFIQGLAKGLGIKEKILSPTFVILKKFKITKIKNQKLKIKNTNQNLKILRYKTLYHIDCYRIKKPKELLDLGFKEIISNPKNIVTIEWAERVREILPKKIILIKFKFIDKNKRKISIRT